MYNTIKQALVLSLFFCSAIASADCKLESEIPSSTPNSRFTTDTNGTVTDNVTKLMWAKCALGQNETDCTGNRAAKTWQGALHAAESSILASHTDWRLPNIKELRSIVEKRCFNPSINSAIFPNTPALAFLSASPSASNSYGAWYVNFNGGGTNYFNQRGSYSHLVRLVRSPPVSE